MKVLHLGCGRKGRDLPVPVPPDAEIITLDADGRLGPDVLCVLGRERLPLPDDSIDLAVAWHVLEHIGDPGSSGAWFDFWEDLYRVLTPNGRLMFEAPHWQSVWAWADPTHVRVLSPEALVFFDQDNYRIPGSAISPYRIACDFVPGPYRRVGEHFQGMLTARKPLQVWWETPIEEAVCAK